MKAPTLPLSSAPVAIIMGSQSDWEVMEEATQVPEKLAVDFSTQVVSAHRTPQRLVEFAAAAAGAGVQIIIAGAGGAAHLPGMVAAMTPLPVIAVPVPSRHLQGLDSLLSIVQMPRGVAVATQAIGSAGAFNAGLLAVQILALSNPALSERLRRWRRTQMESVPVEKEAVDVELLREFSRLCPVHPDPGIIEICQHRGRERSHLAALGVATADFRLISSLGQLKEAAVELGFPLILKACVQGYDGRNQWPLNTAADIDRLFANGWPVPEAVLERKVSFEREVSVLAVRNRRGEQRCYPITENFHSKGVLLASLAPAMSIGNEQQRQLREIVDRLLGQWDYCGVLTIECFSLGDTVLVNELAPRVHNSGHWTHLGANISQFENHLRAISWMQLPEIRHRRHVAMINLLGLKVPTGLCRDGLHLHAYPKQLRPGRKMGHVNLLGSSREQLLEKTERLMNAIYGAESRDTREERDTPDWTARGLRGITAGNRSQRTNLRLPV